MSIQYTSTVMNNGERCLSGVDWSSVPNHFQGRTTEGAALNKSALWRKEPANHLEASPTPIAEPLPPSQDIFVAQPLAKRA